MASTPSASTKGKAKPQAGKASGRRSVPADTSARDEMLEEIKTAFEQRLADMAANPTQWVEFLEQVVLFGAQYSMGNQMMLIEQCVLRGVEPRYFLPFGAKDGSSGWLSHDRHVRKGETAFYVWAPVRRRPSEEQAQQWEAAGRKVLRDDKGRPVVQVVGFRPSATFELSQTEGAPFEPPTVQRLRRIRAAGGQQAELLTGDDPTGAFDDVVELIKADGYTFDLAPPGSPYLGGANGVTVKGTGLQLVRVRDDVAPAQRFKTTCHEWAHIRCGHLDGERSGEDLHRGRRETEAESVAHIICKVLGLDTHAYSDAYVLDWAGGDIALIRECGETVIRVARGMLAALTPAEPNPDAQHGDGVCTDTDDLRELAEVAG